MSTEEFRSAVFGTIESWGLVSYPNLPIVYENGPVPDEAMIGPVWLDVEIRWYGAVNTTVGERPRGRETGAISLNIFYREAHGTQMPDALVDSLGELLRNRRIGAAVLSLPQRTVPTCLRGWYKTGRLVPFHLDSA